MQELQSLPDSTPVHYSDPLYLEEQELRRRPIGKPRVLPVWLRLAFWAAARLREG